MGNVIMKAQQITYGASNVEKALDDLNVPELIELNKRMDAADAWKANVHEETYTGSELTIENALALPARSLITSINAIQDLHGYDHPWAGGAYKNKLPLTVSGLKAINTDGTWSGNIYTFNGATAEILTDAANNVTGIKVNGTPSLAFTFYLIVGFTSTDYPNQMKVNGAYGVGNNNAFIRVQELNTWTVLADDTGASADGVAFTTTSIPSQAIIRVYQGTTVTNAVFYPMFRLATESDASFAPYSNICPISGRTAAVITRSDGDEISEDFTLQLGTTVYGADINWDTGVMTVKTVCPDLGGLTWTADATGVANKNRFYADLSPLAVVADSVNLTSISSQYTLLAPGGTYSANADGYTITAASKIYIYDESLSSATAADFKTAMSGVQVEYTLATPTTIQLTPTQLEMLKGYNRITVASGYATIELKALVLGGDN